MNVRPSRREDGPAIRRLWRQAFGDGDACIDAFFDALWQPERILTLHDGGGLRAMACCLPAAVRSGGREWTAAYLYAVATDEAARGRGYCTELLDFAAEFLRERGVAALLLVPGEETLRAFYRARGFSDWGAVTRREYEKMIPPAGGGAEFLTAPEYLALRERLLEGTCYVASPAPVLAFQEAMARLYGGGLLRLWDGGREGCACAVVDEYGRAVAGELLWPGGAETGAALTAKALGTARVLARTPAGGLDGLRRGAGGDGVPFAMVRWLAEPPEIPAPYFALALD